MVIAADWQLAWRWNIIHDRLWFNRKFNQIQEHGEVQVIKDMQTT
jgi:hypothetical protein